VHTPFYKEDFRSDTALDPTRVTESTAFNRLPYVSELERRLKLSDYFSDVKLLPGTKVAEQNQELFRFELSAKVKY